mgnify:CR=1 FL=1
MLCAKLLPVLILIACSSATADLILKWDPDNIKKREMWRSCRATTEADGSVVFLFKTKAPWPSFSLQPAKSKYWNLSNFRYIAFDAENLNKSAQCEFVVKINGKGIGSGVLEPGEKSSFLFKINHRGNQKFDPLFLGKGMPDGFTGGYNVDTAKVEKISFASYYPTYAEYRISKLRATGDYSQTDSTKTAESFFPFIDAYGQYIHDEWTGKIKQDSDLKENLNREKKEIKPRIVQWNKWGGWKNGPQLKSTGFFHPVKYQGKWWLVDPDGKLFFSRGVNAISSDDFISGKKRAKIFAVKSRRHDGGYMFFENNLKLKYGKDFPKTYYPFIHRRLDSWGFNTVANWSDHGISKLRKHPYALCLRMYKEKQWPKLKDNKFYDVYTPEFEEKINLLTKKVPWTKNDPWCIGIFIGNELNFGNNQFLATATIKSPASQPAKQALVNMLKSKYKSPAALNKAWDSSYKSWQDVLNSTQVPKSKKAKDDLKKFSTEFVERFFKICRDAIKKHSPKTMYLGSRLYCGSDYFRPYLNKSAAKFCDVVSYNLYQLSYDRLAPWGMPDVPIMITESTVGDRSRGRFIAHTDPGAGQNARQRALRIQLRSAARHPQIVGLHHFSFKDQVLTGRWGRGGENFGFGLVDITDTPYQNFVNENRLFSEGLYQFRLKSKPVIVK